MDKLNFRPTARIGALVLASALTSFPAQAQRVGPLVAEVLASGDALCVVKGGASLPLPAVAGEARPVFPQKATLLCRGVTKVALTALTLVPEALSEARAGYRDGLGGLWTAERTETGIVLKPAFFAYRFGEGRSFASLVESENGAGAPAAASPAASAVKLEAARAGLASARNGIGEAAGFGRAADGSVARAGIAEKVVAAGAAETVRRTKLSKPSLGKALEMPTAKTVVPAPEAAGSPLEAMKPSAVWRAVKLKGAAVGMAAADNVNALRKAMDKAFDEAVAAKKAANEKDGRVSAKTAGVASGLGAAAATAGAGALIGAGSLGAGQALVYVGLVGLISTGVGVAAGLVVAGGIVGYYALKDRF